MARTAPPQQAAAVPADWVILGRISGVYGVKGWLKIESWTRPREAIFGYSPWQIGISDGAFRTYAVRDGRPQGQGLVVALEGLEDRELARGLIGQTIAVARSELPPPEAGEVYWADLMGCRVVNRAGVDLGVVDHLIETGANDVLVIRGERERLVPYIDEVIVRVELETKCITVDWDAGF